MVIRMVLLFQVHVAERAETQRSMASAVGRLNDCIEIIKKAGADFRNYEDSHEHPPYSKILGRIDRELRRLSFLPLTGHDAAAVIDATMHLAVALESGTKEKRFSELEKWMLTIIGEIEKLDAKLERKSFGVGAAIKDDLHEDIHYAIKQLEKLRKTFETIGTDNMKLESREWHEHPPYSSVIGKIIRDMRRFGTVPIAKGETARLIDHASHLARDFPVKEKNLPGIQKWMLSTIGIIEEVDAKIEKRRF